MQATPLAPVFALVGVPLVVAALEDPVMYLLIISILVKLSSLLLVCWLAPFPVWVPPPLSGESGYCPSPDLILPHTIHSRTSLGNVGGFQLVLLRPPLSWFVGLPCI